MAEKILGIDIGSYSLKAVQISRGFRTRQISGYAIVGLPQDHDPAQIARALKDLISENSLESDHYLVAVGTQGVFLRRLSFPFTADRKIEQVIRFELEPLLPLGIDEVQVDFVKTEQRSNGEQGVVAAAMPRRLLDPLVSALEESGLVPEVIDLDASGLNIIASELREQLPERLVILDVGHRKTNMFYREKGRDAYLRALMFGCERLAKSLAEVLEIPFDEGLKRIPDLDLAELPGAPAEESAREAIVREVEFLAREVQVSLLSAQIQEQQLSPEVVIIIGGGSLLKGLAPTLERLLEIPVRRLGDFEDLDLFGQFGNQSGDTQVHAVAAGVALRSANRRAGFNFQTEDSIRQSPFVKWRRHLNYLLVAASLVVFSWLGSVGVDMYTKKQRLLRLDRSIETVFRRALPDFKGNARTAQYGSIMKARINELSESVTLFGAEGGQDSAVELLRQISQAISADFDVTLDLLTLDSRHVRLNGRADGFNNVDAIKSKLEASRNFATVTITGAKAATDDKGVRFSIQLIRHPVSGEGS